MKKPTSPAHALLACVLLLAPYAPAAHAQQPVPPPPPRPAPMTRQTPPAEQVQPEDDDEVVRITTNLVQIDVTVVDRDGRQVTDLAPEEFEVYEGGKRQTITNFSYVSVVPDAPARTPASAAAANSAPAPARPRTDRRAPPVPPVRLRPEQVRRTFVFLVDDLALSPESVVWVKDSLKKFIAERLEPTDVAAVVRTSAGVGAFQQFTSDRQQLRAAADRLRYYHNNRCSDFSEKIGDMEMPGGANEGADRSGTTSEKQNRMLSRAHGTLGALNAVVTGLRDLPGRKAVIMMSDCFQLIDFEGVLHGTAAVGMTTIRDNLRRLVDRANRASVVINTLDPRGPQALGPTAADGALGGVSMSATGRPYAGVVQPRTGGRGSIYAQAGDREFQERTGLVFLARETGGLALVNSNDIVGSLGRVAEDQKGYYLIGYRPDDDTFARGGDGRSKFHNLKVEVKRAGLRVRTRTGFYGMTDAEARPAPTTREGQLTAALRSPFSAGQIDVRLTSLFANDPASGSYLRSLLHIDTRPLTFAKEPDGRHKAVVDIVALTLDADERVVNQVNGTETLLVSDEGLERLRRGGLDYVLNVPVKQAGPHHLRVAVRDASSARVGSASQFVEVPDLTKNRLALSGIALSGATPATTTNAASAAAPDTDAAQQSGPAVRRLRQGEVVNYGFIIFNARADRQTNLPRLTTQVRLFRAGALVFEGAAKPFDPAGQTDLKRLVAGGSVQTGVETPPGDYVLQLVVQDLLAGGDKRTATQWVDFEIVK